MSQVDVIVPCYKYGDFLRQCVESILTQSMSDLRVLILDDASPDHTAEVASELVAQDSRVHFVRHSTNQGHIATFNEGLDWTEGEYTVLLSADDLLTPGSLARAVKVMSLHPEVGMVYGRGIEFQSDEATPEPEACSEAFGWRIRAGAEFLEAFCVAGCNLVSTPTAFVRTRLQKAIGGYREELSHTGDMEMWMRFAVHAEIAMLNTEQALYRRHSSNMSSAWYRSPFVELMQRKAAFDLIFSDYSDLIRDAGRLRALADRTLARETFWQATSAFDEGELSSCRELLDFASEIDPELRDKPEWNRISWKLRLGPKVCAALRPLVRLTRQARAICSSQPSHQIPLQANLGDFQAR